MSWPRASRTGAFARPSTCAAIASARASTSTSTRRCPTVIDGARHALYPPLADLANEWAQRLGEPATFPADLDDFLARCHRAGQRRTTPLILRYREGGHNTLHQDVYGDVAFPLQVVTMLDRPGRTSRAASSPARVGGLRGRPVRPARAAPARAVARPRHRPRARRLPDLPHPPPPRAGDPRPLPGDHAPRRRDGALRPAHHAGRHLPRRRLSSTSTPSRRRSSPRSKRPWSRAISARSSSRPPAARLASAMRAMLG